MKKISILFAVLLLISGCKTAKHQMTDVDIIYYKYIKDFAVITETISDEPDFTPVVVKYFAQQEVKEKVENIKVYYEEATVLYIEKKDKDSLWLKDIIQDEIEELEKAVLYSDKMVEIGDLEGETLTDEENFELATISGIFSLTYQYHEETIEGYEKHYEISEELKKWTESR